MPMVGAEGHPVYDAGANGEVAGSATAVQLPTVSCRMVLLVAMTNNVGNVYLGWNSGVTKADGTTDTTSGIPLAPGQRQLFFINNLNKLWIICDNAGDDLLYLTYL